MSHWIEQPEDCRNQARWSDYQTGSCLFIIRRPRGRQKNNVQTMLGGCGRLRHISFCVQCWGPAYRLRGLDPTVDQAYEITILFQASLGQAWHNLHHDSSMQRFLTHLFGISHSGRWLLYFIDLKGFWSHFEMVNWPFTLKTWCLASESSDGEGACI